MSLLPCVRAPKLLPTVPEVSVPFYVLVCFRLEELVLVTDVMQQHKNI